MSPTRLALALGVAVGIALGTPALVFRALDAFGAEKVEVGLDLLDPVDAGLAALRERNEGAGRGPAQWDVAYLGDSMVVAYPEAHRVPLQLQRALDRRTGVPERVRVDSLAAPGMSPFDYYFLADRIAAAGPDQVILPVNLAAFSKTFLAAFARPELAGQLPPARVPQALALPLFGIGVTADRLLVEVATVALGAEHPWRRLVSQQARVGRARRQLANALGQRIARNADARFELLVLGRLTEEQQLAGTRRFNLVTLRDRYGVVLDGIGPENPTLRVLAAAIRNLREYDVDVLVYTSPMNVEHTEHLGLSNPEGLGRSLSSIEAVVRGAGATFVDLHAILPDEGFRDGAGHLAVEGAVDGPRELAEHLAPAVLAAAERRGEPRTADRPGPGG